jgi:hypothetical protein
MERIERIPLMTNIEKFLSGAIDYDMLTDDERCAICNAMEGCWVEQGKTFTNPPKNIIYVVASRNTVMPYRCECMDHFKDGTAALQLLQRIEGSLYPSGNGDTGAKWWEVETEYENKGQGRMDTIFGTGDTPQAAIVATVCAIARAQWPYQVAANV